MGPWQAASRPPGLLKKRKHADAGPIFGAMLQGVEANPRGKQEGTTAKDSACVGILNVGS
eukprot:1949851-Amphidinium_carterae.1